MNRTVLAGGSALDVATGQLLATDVALEGEWIVELGQQLNGDRIIDCSGRLIMPGFIDTHTHVALTTRMGAERTERLPHSAHTLSVVPVLRTLLRRGVTTIRDAWGADAGVRWAVRQGWIDGPQVLVSLRQLCTTGGIGDHWSPELGGLVAGADPSLPDPVFDGPDAARAAVRRMVRAGTDWIKVTATGSIHEGAQAHDVQLTEPEMVAVVDEAARQGGRQVMVHAHGARAAELAAHAGARSIEHGTFLDETAVAAMVEAGTWLVPTLSVTHGDTQGADPDIVSAHVRSVRLAIEAGVPIAMGSDNPEHSHHEVLREIAHLARAGLGPAGALRAATLDAARLLGLGDRGQISSGKRADLVVLSGTTLDPTRLDQRITAVWQGGSAIDLAQGT